MSEQHDYNSENGTIRGKVWWAQVHNPSQYGKYEICVGLDDEAINTLTNHGVADRIQKDQEGINDGGPFIRIKQPAVNASGGENVIEVVDAKVQPLKSLIGNESLCNVAFRSYMPKPPHNTRRTMRLDGVQVLELVEYQSEGQATFGIQEDFIVEDASPEEDSTPEVSFELEA